MKIKAYKRAALLVLGAIILGLILWGITAQRTKVWEITRFILYAIAIAYVLTPISKRLELYMPRARATLAVYVAIILLSLILMLLFIPILIRQTIALINRLPSIALRTQNMIGKFQGEMVRLGIPYGIQITFNEYFEKINGWIASYIKGKMDGAVDGIGKITAFFTIPVLSFYFTKDRDEFKDLIMNIIPSKIRVSTLKMAREINRILNRFIRGQLLVALIVGGLTTLGYLIIGLPYAFIMGLFMGIFEIVPYVGPVLGAIPASVIAISHSPSKLLATIIVVVVVQQLESNIFTPKIMGDHVGLHPVYIIIVLWMAGVFFGVLGMFFAVPSVLILRVIIKSMYESIVSSNDWGD